jgi:hypothetical protein
MTCPSLTLAVYGCPGAEVDRLNGYKKRDEVGSRTRAYTNQRRNAKWRGIGWEMTFPEWCAIWDASGRSDQKGSSKADHYQMARHGDTGPYKVGNVSIQTKSQNGSDAGSNYAALRNRLRAQSAKGYVYTPEVNKSKPYRVRVGHRPVGAFATAEEATAAYRAVAFPLFGVTQPA